MTELHHVALIEQPRNDAVDLRMFLDCARTVSPVLHYTGCDFEPTCLRLAERHGATAIMTGELGDHIFGQGVRDEATAEYLWRNGFGTEFLSVLVDHCLLQRVSFWRGIRSARRRMKSLKRKSCWSLYQYGQDHHPELGRLVTGECLADYEAHQERFIHPWFQQTQEVPCGKFLLIHGLIAVTSSTFQSPFAGEDASLFVAPLISQPLVETALRIPTYFNIHRGEDRSVARHAFGDDLSELVLRRGSAKGTTEIWVRDLVLHNLDFVRETLLGGVLVKERILERHKLEELLSKQVNRSASFVADALEQLYIECWLRKMTCPDICAAA